MSLQSSDTECARRFFGYAGEEFCELAYKAFDVQSCLRRVSSLQVSDRLSELATGSRFVPTAEMVHADGCLDQPLVARLERGIGSRAPQIFPDLMGVIKPSFVKQQEAFTQQVRHEHKSN